MFARWSLTSSGQQRKQEKKKQMARSKKNANQEPKAAPQGRKVPKEVNLKLTPQQCLERTTQASNINKEKTDLQAQFEAEEKEWKKRRAEFKSGIKNLSEQVDKILSEVKAKAATETVDVILVLNHESGSAEYWFQPQGGEWEKVDERPLEENERQAHIPGTEEVEARVAAMPETGQEVQA